MDPNACVRPNGPKGETLQFFCQICKGNISIYGRSAKGIIRHHSIERDFRKDQRWRYQQLAVEDPLTKAIHRQVRDRKGQILAPNDLRRKYHYFKDGELVDIEEKLHYYHEAMAGKTHMASSSENRVRAQN